MGLKAGTNTYIYVNNNPFRWIDIYGLEKLNLFGPTDLIRPLYDDQHQADIPGFLDIFSHGNSSVIADDRDGHKIMSPLETYNMIIESDLWTPGMPIRFFGCSTAEGENSFVEQISKLFGEDAVIVGADQPVFPNLLGGLLGTYETKRWPMNRYPDRSKPGNWLPYKNGKRIDAPHLLPMNR